MELKKEMILKEKVKSEVEEIQKSQLIRLADVFLIAPFLFYVSSKREISRFDRNMLFGLGVATLIYNGMNYIENKSYE